jgi:hypothetical protein
MAASPLPLDHSQSSAVNLSVLQQKDPAVTAVLATSPHVAMYEFNAATKSWARKDVEGTLFVVLRCVVGCGAPPARAAASILQTLSRALCVWRVFAVALVVAVVCGPRLCWAGAGLRRRRTA